MNASAEQEPLSAETLSPAERARRRLIGWMLGVSASVLGVLMAIPLVRVALYPLLAQAAANPWADLGPEDDFRSLTTPVRRVIQIRKLDGWRQITAERVVYVTKGADGKLEVLTAVCPHLGCEVQWNPDLGQFKCPCHGGTFAPDGRHLSGPPPRGMDPLPLSVENGRLRVQYEYFRNLVPTREVMS